MATKPEAPETTPPTDWIIPNQAKVEQVIDARWAKLVESEKSTRSSRSSAAKPDDKDDDKKS
jgi:hypothetical protein